METHAKAGSELAVCCWLTFENLHYRHASISLLLLSLLLLLLPMRNAVGKRTTPTTEASTGNELD